MTSLSESPAATVTARICSYKLSPSCASVLANKERPACALKFRTPKMCTSCYNYKARSSWVTRKSSAARPSPSQLVEIQQLLLRQVNKSLVNTVTNKINIIKQLTAQLEEAKNNQSQLSRSGNPAEACLSFIGEHLKNNEALMLSLKNSMYEIQENNRRRHRCVYCPPCVECQDSSEGSDLQSQSTTYDER